MSIHHFPQMNKIKVVDGVKVISKDWNYTGMYPRNTPRAGYSKSLEVNDVDEIIGLTRRGKVEESGAGRSFSSYPTSVAARRPWVRARTRVGDQSVPIGSEEAHGRDREI